MTQPDFSNIKACVFDAYGTLFDVDAAARHEKDALGENWKSLSDLWRLKQLQYTWLLSLQGNYRSFWDITEDALQFAMKANQISDAKLAARLMQIYRELDCYPEVPETLKTLKEAGIKCAILSNGDMDMLQSAVDNAKIGEYLDAILTVQDVNIFKPHPSVYQLANERLNLPSEAISFQSSNGWDAFSAKDYGFNVIWCNRFDQPDEQIPSAPDHQIKTLNQMLPLLNIKA